MISNIAIYIITNMAHLQEYMYATCLLFINIFKEKKCQDCLSTNQIKITKPALYRAIRASLSYYKMYGRHKKVHSIQFIWEIFFSVFVCDVIDALGVVLLLVRLTRKYWKCEALKKCGPQRRKKLLQLQQIFRGYSLKG